MKNLFFTIIMFWMFLAVSCTKTATQSSTNSTFIKVIQTDSNFNCVSSFQLSDGSFMVFGADPQYIRSGLIVKLSSTGTILWQKRMPGSITKLWKVISVNGTEFAAVGFKSGTPDFNINVCTFDNEGNLLSTKSNSPGYYPFNNPLDMIQLSNGNYAFTGTLGNDTKSNFYIYLMVTDASFNVQYLNTYQLPQFNICSIGLAETGNGNINITGVYRNSNANTTFLLRTNMNTIMESFDTVPNNSETPNCITAGNNGVLVVSSISQSGGSLTVTDNSSAWQVISGSIGIDNFDTAGHFINRTSISGYSGDGIINSIKSTADGGFLLCGTVNMSSDTTGSTPTHMYAIKLNGSLNEQWSNSYDTYYSSFGVNAIQTNDGGYLITGQHRSFNNHFDMVLIKTDANGNSN